MVLTVSSAQTVLDQYYQALPSGVVSLNSTSYAGQSFTVGIEGQLTRVDLTLDRTSLNVTENAEIVVAKLDLSSGTMTPVASGIIPFDELPTFSGVLVTPLPMVSMDFSETPVSVKVGDTFAILAHSAMAPSVEDQIRWYLSDNFFQHYDGEFRFQTTSPSSSIGGSDMSSDLEFATYVTIPEPSPFFLCLVGLAAISSCPIYLSRPAGTKNFYREGSRR